MEQEPMEKMKAGGHPVCVVAGCGWDAQHAEPADSTWLCPPSPAALQEGWCWRRVKVGTGNIGAHNAGAAQELSEMR